MITLGNMKGLLQLHNAMRHPDILGVKKTHPSTAKRKTIHRGKTVKPKKYA